MPRLPRKSTGITGSDNNPLYRFSIRKSQIWIETKGHKIFCVPRTRRVSTDQDAHVRKQERKMPYTELLKSKTPAENEAIRIPSATQVQSNTNMYFTSYAPAPPLMPKKIVEYNSSTSKEIIVSCVKALKYFKLTQSAMVSLTDAPDTIDPEAQEDKAGEQNKAEVLDTSESNLITQEGPEGNGQDETQTLALLSSFAAHILYWMKKF